ALGAILYELLTGRPPFRDPSILKVLEQVRHHDVVPPSRLQPGVPRQLETICLKCLEKDPQHRYASAWALAEDLERWLHGERIHPRLAPWPYRVRRWLRRYPRLSSAAAVVAGFMALSVLAAAREYNQTEPGASPEQLDFIQHELKEGRPVTL